MDNVTPEIIERARRVALNADIPEDISIVEIPCQGAAPKYDFEWKWNTPVSINIFVSPPPITILRFEIKRETDKEGNIIKVAKYLGEK